MSPDPSRDRFCERCGTSIPADAPAGDCPSCLMKAGLGDMDDRTAELLDLDTVRNLFPRLEIQERIGRGGMGVVFRARQRSLDRPVALKILAPELADRPGFAERFTREAQSLAKLDHPNIVRVFEAEQDGDLCYLLMECVDGTNLRHAIESKLEPSQALRIVSEICDALQYAHDNGVVHRDIKPENILLDRQGRAKIADFGLAKLAGDEATDHALTRTRDVMGTAHYMAPEQMRGGPDVDHRADIYSLGVVFYEMLTGNLPLGRFPVPSEKVAVDVRLDEVVLRSLENERERRYQRADDMKTRVTSISDAPSFARLSNHRSPPPAPPRDEAIEQKTSTKALWGVFSPLIGLAAGVLVFALGMAMNDGRTSDALQACATIVGLSIVIAGMILSGIARREIRDNPRLTGKGIATAGLIAPLILGFLSIAGLGTMFIVLRRAQVRSLEASRVADLQFQREAAVHDLIGRLEAAEYGGLEGVLDCYTPDAKESLTGLTQAEWKERGADGSLNLPGMIAAGVVEMSDFAIPEEPFIALPDGREALRIMISSEVMLAPIEPFGDLRRFTADPTRKDD